MRRLAYGLLAAHAVALVFGLLGMLVALPNPQLWAGNPMGAQVFSFGMQYAGSLHVILGAGAMLVFGAASIGWRRTLIFLVASAGISLASELVGTGTGYPFGNYEYTEGLGWKVLGRVPFSIPLSWFYVGLACLLVGERIAAERGWRPRGAFAVMLGAYLLTVWDLVLDPAMADPSLPLRFWVWHETGPYFGMPLQNLLGWIATGATFMAVGRWLWGRALEPERVPLTLPLAVYGLNLLFAMVLSGYAGLWGANLIAMLGLAPVLLLWAPARRDCGRP